MEEKMSPMYRAWFFEQAWKRWQAEEAAAPVSMESELEPIEGQRDMDIVATIEGCSKCNANTMDLFEDICFNCFFDNFLEEE